MNLRRVPVAVVSAMALAAPFYLSSTLAAQVAGTGSAVTTTALNLDHGNARSSAFRRCCSSFWCPDSSCRCEGCRRRARRCPRRPVD
jgi:hypothetical protein